MNFQFNSLNHVICSLSSFFACLYLSLGVCAFVWAMLSMAVPQKYSNSDRKYSEGKNCMANNGYQIFQMYVSSMRESELNGIYDVNEEKNLNKAKNLLDNYFCSKVYHWKICIHIMPKEWARARAVFRFDVACSLLCTGTHSTRSLNRRTMLHSNFEAARGIS